MKPNELSPFYARRLAFEAKRAEASKVDGAVKSKKKPALAPKSAPASKAEPAAPEPDTDKK